MRNTTVLIVSAFAGFGAFWWTLAKEPPPQKPVPRSRSTSGGQLAASTGRRQMLSFENATDRLRADPLDIIAWGSLGFRLGQTPSPTDAIDMWIAVKANAPLRDVGQTTQIARYWTGHGLRYVGNESEGIAMIREAADFFADLTSRAPEAATYLDWRTAAFSEYHATRESPDLESIGRKLDHAARMLVPRLSADPQSRVLAEQRRRLGWLGGEIDMAVDFDTLMQEGAVNTQR